MVFFINRFERLIDKCEKHISAGKMDRLQMFKAVAKNVSKDAAKTLDELWALWELEPKSEKLREKFDMLEYYLSYLIRFCEQEK